MIESLFWLAVGTFVGWNFPQPNFAKKIQGWVVELYKKNPTN